MLELAQKGALKMFCPQCGKQVNDEDNFCRFCGIDLRNEVFINENIDEKPDLEISENKEDDEFVLYEVKKHWMALVIPVFLIPLFLFYFVNIFLNSLSFLSWIVLLALIAYIIYPIIRFNSDRIIVTNRFVHLKMGVLNPEETDISLEEIDVFDVSQTTIGRLFDYGTISFCLDSNSFDYRYIKAPEDFQYIIENPQQFINETLEEDNNTEEIINEKQSC